MLCKCIHEHNSENSPLLFSSLLRELCRFTVKEQSEECAFSGQVDFYRLGRGKNREISGYARKNGFFSSKGLQKGKMFVSLQPNPPRMRYCRGPANPKSWLFFVPPSHHSEAIAKIPGVNVIRMQWHETRFKQSLLPDEIILKKSGYKLVIPDKWKDYKVG